MKIEKIENQKAQTLEELLRADTDETSSFELIVEDEGESTEAVDAQPSSQGASSKEILCRDLCETFVRREGRFYWRNNPASSISAADLKRVAVIRFMEKFPDIELTDELWREVYKYAVESVHSDREQTIAVWDGRVECHPACDSGLIWADGAVAINTWTKPGYRSLGISASDSSMLEELLTRACPQEQDRTIILDWLSWSLQNENEKPSWSLLFYSPSKGTGKSSLAQLLGLLFGEENSISINGISKLTGRFNQTVMTRKFVMCEEVKLKLGTDGGNAVKAYITEPTVAVEGKGKECLTSAPTGQI